MISTSVLSFLYDTISSRLCVDVLGVNYKITRQEVNGPAAQATTE